MGKIKAKGESAVYVIIKVKDFYKLKNHIAVRVYPLTSHNAQLEWYHRLKVEIYRYQRKEKVVFT